MKRIMSVVLSLVVVFGVSCLAYSQGQYTPGIEGMAVGSYLPNNDGFTIRVDNAFYYADNVKGSVVKDFDQLSYTAFVRGFYGVSTSVLGATWVPNISIPVIYDNFDIGNVNVEDYDFGNVYVEPIAFIWEFEKFDVVASAGFFAPTTDEDNFATFGNDYWTGLIRGGGTYYFGDIAPWSVSGLLSYEFNTDSDKYDIEIGNTLTLEGGISKVITDDIKLGVAGYAQWQLNDNEGVDRTFLQFANDAEVYAVGPQIDYNIKSWDVTVSAKSLFEFGAKERSNGNLTVFSISKSF